MTTVLSALSHQWFSSSDYLRADAQRALEAINHQQEPLARKLIVSSLMTYGFESQLAGQMLRAANWLALGRAELAAQTLAEALEKPI